MPKILDQVIVKMNFEVQLDKKTSQKVENDFEKSVENATKDGIIKGNQKASRTFTKDMSDSLARSQGTLYNLRNKQEKKLEADKAKREKIREARLGKATGFIQAGASGGILGIVGSMGPYGAAIAAAIAAVILPMLTTMKKGIEKTEEQLNVADQIATKAVQSNMSIPEYLKLTKLMELNDVAPEAAAQAITELSKRRGDPAYAAEFAKMGVTAGMSEAQAFLTVISGLQHLKGAERNYMADRFFGGLGTEQLAELIGGNLRQQAKTIKNIDFNALANQVEKGAQEQSKLSAAYSEQRTNMLLNAPMNADPRISQIRSETARDIKTMKSGNAMELVQGTEVVSNALNSLAVTITETEKVFFRMIKGEVNYVAVAKDYYDKTYGKLFDMINPMKQNANQNQMPD